MNFILLFLALIFFQTILKSIDDRRKIQKENTQRVRKITTLEKSKPILDYNYDNVLDREKLEEREETVAQMVVENKNITQLNMKSDNFDSIAVDRISEVDKSYDKLNKQNRTIKNYILKGIIFAEVLSEPRAVKNIRRNI